MLRPPPPLCSPWRSLFSLLLFFSMDRGKPSFESRLDDLREQARLNGEVHGHGVNPAGGPMPRATTPEQLRGPGYFGLPIIKPPVWEWMIAVYFFIGGLAGMSGLIAAGALIKS